MRKRLRTACLALAAAASVAAIAPATSAAATTCTGTLTSDVVGTLIVPNGVLCDPNGYDIYGNVIVEAGGLFQYLAPNSGTTQVFGNVTSTGGQVIFQNGQITGNVNISNSPYNQDISIARVGGSITFTNVGGYINVSNANVTGGGIKLVGNSGGAQIFANTVSGGVTLTNNVTGSGTWTVSQNTIGGALSCSGNTPPPTAPFGPNAVSGAATGQCAGPTFKA